MRRSLKLLLFVTLVFCGSGFANEKLDITVIRYDDFSRGDPQALEQLKQALYDQGIVGVRGIPTYREKVLNLIETAREFSALPEEVKEAYAPQGEMFLGYERGKEKFQRPDGSWVIDDLKISYYGLVPDRPQNKWPSELDLKDPFLELGQLMADIGEEIMLKLGMIGVSTGIYLDETPRVGRMLYYCKNGRTDCENPYWCGDHFDHSMFTALVPAFYFEEGKQIPEPEEAGLFVKIGDTYKKVVADDPNVMMFQVGEFGQLVMNDKIRATKHRVQKATGNVERYTMVLFTDAPMDAVIHSTSELTNDSRYRGMAGDPCSYRDWNARTFERYIVRDE